MPLSHVTLTVASLPTSTSFFLSALQPLGYRFVDYAGRNVGFGAQSGAPADFWLAEEQPNCPAGAAHIAFPAPSPAAVDVFFSSALTAGGQIHGSPANRGADGSYYSAAVIDFDGNSVEAVYRPSASPTRPVVQQPAAEPPTSEPGRKGLDGTSTAIGTLIGAAGAVLAYAMFSGDKADDGHSSDAESVSMPPPPQQQSRSMPPELTRSMPIPIPSQAPKRSEYAPQNYSQYPNSYIPPNYSQSYAPQNYPQSFAPQNYYSQSCGTVPRSTFTRSHTSKSYDPARKSHRAIEAPPQPERRNTAPSYVKSDTKSEASYAKSTCSFSDYARTLTSKHATAKDLIESMHGEPNVWADEPSWYESQPALPPYQLPLQLSSGSQYTRASANKEPTPRTAHLIEYGPAEDYFSPKLSQYSKPPVSKPASQLSRSLSQASKSPSQYSKSPPQSFISSFDGHSAAPSPRNAASIIKEKDGGSTASSSTARPPRSQVASRTSSSRSRSKDTRDTASSTASSRSKRSAKSSTPPTSVASARDVPLPPSEIGSSASGFTIGSIKSRLSAAAAAAAGVGSSASRASHSKSQHSTHSQHINGSRRSAHPVHSVHAPRSAVSGHSRSRHRSHRFPDDISQARRVPLPPSIASSSATHKSGSTVFLDARGSDDGDGEEWVDAPGGSPDGDSQVTPTPSRRSRKSQRSKAGSSRVGSKIGSGVTRSRIDEEVLPEDSISQVC